ncbi:hypothetical protein QQ045_000283 [Rhodiola kirilowii]
MKRADKASKEGVYASNDSRERVLLWKELEVEMVRTKGNWLFLGDCNSVLKDTEKLNGAKIRSADIKDFNNFVVKQT